jgi:hypothetical protein
VDDDKALITTTINGDGNNDEYDEEYGISGGDRQSRLTFYVQT